MSETSEQDSMRPIPDGGLQENMPSWLKRPPAWRNKTLTAEERFERTLPEPDTSTIDPATLVSVDDLPQWLQNIAARGPIPVPEPDPATEHAVEIIQAAHHPKPVLPQPKAEEESVPTPESSEHESADSLPTKSTEPESSALFAEPLSTMVSQPDPSVPKREELEAPSVWKSFGVASIAIVLAGLLIILWLYL